MQNQNQIRRREESNKPISEQIISNQIKRDTSRLDAGSENFKKKIQLLYFWIWVLLGVSALLLIFILLGR